MIYVQTRTTEISKSRTRRIVENAGNTILDVGCGSGSYVWFLQQRGYDVYGLDISPQPFRKGLSRSIIRGDACHLPFKNQSFDTVVMVNILEHVDDRKALREARRVCKENVIFSVPHEKESELGDYNITYHPYVDLSHLRYYTIERVEETFQDAGLRIVEIGYEGPVNAAGLFLRTLHLPRLPSMWAGSLINKIPGIKKYFYNIEGIATKDE